MVYVCHLIGLQFCSTSIIDVAFKSGNAKTENRVEPGYNDIDLCDTPPIASEILRYKLIHHCWS